jgi:hypothetical protein
MRYTCRNEALLKRAAWSTNFRSPRKILAAQAAPFLFAVYLFAAQFLLTAQRANGRTGNSCDGSMASVGACGNSGSDSRSDSRSDCAKTMNPPHLWRCKWQPAPFDDRLTAHFYRLILARAYSI